MSKHYFTLAGWARAVRSDCWKSQGLRCTEAPKTVWKKWLSDFLTVSVSMSYCVLSFQFPFFSCAIWSGCVFVFRCECLISSRIRFVNMSLFSGASFCFVNIQLLFTMRWMSASISRIWYSISLRNEMCISVYIYNLIYTVYIYRYMYIYNDIFMYITSCTDTDLEISTLAMWKQFQQVKRGIAGIHQTFSWT